MFVIGAAIVIYGTLTLSSGICKDCERKIGQHIPENNYSYASVVPSYYIATTSGSVVGYPTLLQVNEPPTEV